MIKEGLKENTVFDGDTMTEHIFVFLLREKTFTIKCMVLITVVLLLRMLCWLLSVLCVYSWNAMTNHICIPTRAPTTVGLIMNAYAN